MPRSRRLITLPTPVHRPRIQGCRVSGLDFNPHTYPMPTEKPVGIPHTHKTPKSSIPIPCVFSLDAPIADVMCLQISTQLHTFGRTMRSECTCRHWHYTRLTGRVARSPVFYGISRISDPFSCLTGGEAAGKNKSPVFC